MSSLLSVSDVSADLSGVLDRFRTGRTRAFSFGAGVPEAVVLTYDEFEDLGGETRFVVGPEVLAPAALADQLAAVVDAARTGGGQPVVFGESGQREAVVLSVAQYRELRGDDEPPAGVADDPTVRTYATEPLPSSRPFTVDEIADLMGPEAVADLERLRREGHNP